MGKKISRGAATPIESLLHEPVLLGFMVLVNKYMLRDLAMPSLNNSVML